MSTSARLKVAWRLATLATGNRLLQFAAEPDIKT